MSTRTRRRPETRVPAPADPVARLCVDVPLAHLDRPFDYLVPSDLDDAVTPGTRVRVRFAGKLVDGFVLDRVAESEHEGRLAFIERSISAEPVLSPQIAGLAREVADRWAGSLIDVLRLAVPPRHARVESEPARAQPADALAAADPAGWSRYRAGAAFLRELGAGHRARAVWTATAGEDWPRRVAEAMRTTLAGGRGAIAIVPDHRDLARLDLALQEVLGPERHVALSADLGPAERYRRWLAIRRGAVRAVAGTRAAAFAPVADLGLLVVWDDGDDLLAEPRAPYPHARDVALLRSHREGAALVLGAHARTAEAHRLVESGWAHEIVAAREELRRSTPRVMPAGDDWELGRDEAARSARLPSLAWRTARETLESGASVLVQVPRQGYLPALACAQCRAPARCPACQGPLSAPGRQAVPVCRWCGRTAGTWHCPECAGTRLRAVVVGAGRTAEELGRAFSGYPVRRSGGDAVLSTVEDVPALVVATPGAEPLVVGGYGAALFLDPWALLTRPDLRAAEECLRRWANAAALVRSNGTVVVMADGAVPVLQALLRWDMGGYAARELQERTALGFPPAARMAGLTGTQQAVADLIEVSRLPESAELLGPVPVDEEAERMLVRVPHRDGGALAAALHAGAAIRSARKAPDPVRIQLDPLELA